ncbi:Clp protease/crotonase-like domain-containing protein [Chryseobacterium arthrosphaerae]
MKILSEIIGGTWLFNTEDPEQLKVMVKTILSGGRLNEERPELSRFIGGESVIDESSGETKQINKVGYISMTGVMTKYSGLCSLGAQDYVAEALKIDRNPDTLGTIFHIDGFGGNADAMPLFIDVVPKLTKPRICLIDKAFSAHYWAAVLLADHLMLSNDLTAEVGSIGAMIMFEKPKDELIIIRPPESSEKNQDFIDALDGKYDLYIKKLSPLAQRFQNSIITKRPGVKPEVLKGSTYTAQEALQNKLADSIGDVNDAYNWILAKSELQKIKSK